MDDDGTFDKKNREAQVKQVLSSSLKEKLIIPIEDIVGCSPSSYGTYYEMEGDMFPDLWRRAEMTDDVDSKTHYVSLNRASKLHTALLLEQSKKMARKSEKQAGAFKKITTSELLKNFESFITKEKKETPEE